MSRPSQERYRKTPKGQQVNLRAMRRWRQRNPEKYRAHNAVSNALRDGKLKRPDRCSRCGGVGRIEASHDDYSRPLDVEWLCRPCHMVKDGLR